MNDGKAKQQIVEKIKESTNILVTVSTDPSVDELSAALGLTIMLNKLGKHATAVFSGAIPPAITFLDPEKTFESTADSLRDFIIALDKEKADHLRYKVVDNAVKIFITPYRTTITSDDLEFSQGDYNVELVIALGVDLQEHLDSALAAHGRILHDATVTTLSAGDQISNLGSIDWHDEAASSLSEMLVGLSESIKSDKPLLDEQISTALLTGIVAATDRFSNTRTSSRVMTMAAQLMAAGADQQLIAAKLQESHEIGAPVQTEPATDLKIVKTETPAKIEPKQPKAHDGGLAINHEPVGDLDTVAEEVANEQKEEAAEAAEQVLAALPPQPAPAPEPAPLRGAVNFTPTVEEPSFGGTLNATTDQAEDQARKERADDQNKTILTHSYLGDSKPTYDAPINATSQNDEGVNDVDIFAGDSTQTNETTAPTARANSILPPVETVAQPTLEPMPQMSIAPPSGPTLADIDSQNRTPHEEARAAIDAAFGAQPFNPAGVPLESAGAQLLGEVPQGPVPTPQFDFPAPPPLPDFSALPPPPVLPTFSAPAPATTPEILGDIFAPVQPQPLTDQPDNPALFKIPGQQ